MLTTGLRERSDTEWQQLVAGLARVPVAALCFGTGLVHQHVPEVVLKAADDEGLALLQSPVEVPFVQISHWVAEQLYAEKYHDIHTLAVMQNDLIRSISDERGLGSLVRVLSRHLGGASVAIVAPHGELLEMAPNKSSWNLLDGVEAIRGANTPAVPITVEGHAAAYLVAQSDPIHPHLLPFSANIIAMELARKQAMLTGKRELLGQILQELFQGVTAESEAERRLLHFGLDLDRDYRILLASVAPPGDRLHRLPWKLRHMFEANGDQFFTALIEEKLLVLLPEGSDADEIATGMLGELRALGLTPSIGLGSPRRSVHGLRVGFYEARGACAQGPGVHFSAPLSLSGLLLGNIGLPVRELALATLAPILDYDQEHGGQLLETLRVYLAHDGSPIVASRMLMLHRNSLRYRLELIDGLTNRDLRTLSDKLELSLALRALDSDMG